MQVAATEAMDALLGLLTFAVFLMPFIALALRRTNAWMVPGLLLLAGALIMLATIPTVEDDIGGIGAMGAGIQAIGGLGLGFYGLITLACGGLWHKKKTAPVPPVAVLIRR